MSEREEEEGQAEAWLQARGYAASRPTWLPGGRNPDFWAESETLDPSRVWAEVKTIDPDDSTATLSKFHHIIASAKIPAGLRGHCMVHIRPNAKEQSVRWVLKMFAQQALNFADRKLLLAFVQQSRDGHEVRRAEVDATVPEVLWVRGSSTGRIHPPIGLCEDTFAPTRIIHRNGTEHAGKAFEFFEWTGEAECSLVVSLDPADRPLLSISSMSGGSGQTRDRAARALKDANIQIKSACAIRDAPGIVFLVPRGPHVDDTMIASAVYGHLTVPLTLIAGTVEQGDMYHGSDGVFRSSKNTHVSVAIRLRRDGPATIFPNPFARHTITDDAPIFEGAVRANVKFV